MSDKEKQPLSAQEWENALRDVVYISACVINGKTPVREKIWALSREDGVSILHRAANMHLLTAITAEGLERIGIKDSSLHQAKAKAIRKNALLDEERYLLFEGLEKAGVWYMPLKGSILKEEYPGLGLRQMSDNDILIDAAGAAKAKKIMEGLGYRTEAFSKSEHDIYHKEPVCNFELHKALFAKSFDEKIAKYYENVRERLVKDEGNDYGYHFKTEDFYIYLNAHEYKHYSMGGTGLRSFLDIYVFLKKYGKEMDWDYIRGELDKLGIREFEEKSRTLADKLFEGKELTPEEDEMRRYVFSSGTYGTIHHHVENILKNSKGGKFRYMLYRFFVPISPKDRRYEAFAGQYPTFYKHKILLIFLPFYRIICSIKRGGFSAEARALRQIKK